MKNNVLIISLFSVLGFFVFCNSKENSKIQISNSNSISNALGNTIETRFELPDGYKRIEENGFTDFLRKLPLKPEKSLVKYFDGDVKNNNKVYAAVVDLPIGNKDLHQCADAVMRVRADYFYQTKQYDQIHFNFTNGFRVDYSKWKQGFRIAVKGNRTSWVKKAKPSESYESYWEYLENIFMYAGTASLEKELKKQTISNLKVGDVFIKGGFPGHAVIVVDVIENDKKQKKFALAQSYMPAQELQVLLNRDNNTVWYDTDFGETLITPEWTFKANQLKQF
jgi:hypothetical protein